MRPVAVHRLGRVGYASSQALQRSLAAQVRSGVRGDTLLLLEHPPVFTLGRVQQSAANVLASPEEIAAAGASVHQSERGGNVTFHGPGQLVAYPILDLGRFRKSVHWYVEAARPAGGGGLTCATLLTRPVLPSRRSRTRSSARPAPLGCLRGAAATARRAFG